MIDLTHEIHANIPSWDEHCGFHSHAVKKHDTDGYSVFRYEMLGGTGTHIDAPAHFVSDGKDVSSLPLQKLFVAVHVIDVSEKAHQDYSVSSDDVHQYEEQFGEIGENTLVVIYSGWSKRWSDRKNYRNLDANGKMHFPDVSLEAAKLLVKRNISGLAIDTLSPDCFDLSFPVHHMFLQHDIYIIENLANGEQLPKQGAYAIVLPLKINKGTESPLRIVGLVPR